MGNFRKTTTTEEEKSTVDFLHLIDQINVMIEHSAAQWWVIPLVALFCLIDGFFLFLPSETAIVALASIASRNGYPNIWLLILGASMGAIIGDNIAYWMGRKLGVQRFAWMRRPRVAKAFAWAGMELDKRGAVLIFTARYVPVGRIAVNFTAGATSFPWRRFVVLDGIAVLTWASYSVAVGTFAGRWVHDNPLLGVGIAIAFAIAIGIFVDHALKRVHRHLDRRGHKSGSAGTTPGEPTAPAEGTMPGEPSPPAVAPTQADPNGTPEPGALEPGAVELSSPEAPDAGEGDGHTVVGAAVVHHCGGKGSGKSSGKSGATVGAVSPNAAVGAGFHQL
ncbi:DedA family protein [Arthrobacter alpinus]|uniref:DedA family protein n=1 Tax=Arthrobacter alpinus TaxID=656366 RepID=UPI001ED99D99|nr:DedA family protein [Arthrobacter alpinus]